MNILRRRMLLAAPALPCLAAIQGCTSPLPGLAHSSTGAQAQALLQRSARAHGAEALSQIQDISVRYVGKWRPIVGKLQPALVDPGYRGTSEERLLLPRQWVAQAFSGPNGRKHVTRRDIAHQQGVVQVWFDGQEVHDDERRAAAALVVDGYSLFLLGPMVLARYWSADRALVLELEGMQRLHQEGRNFNCDVLRVQVKPGLGFSNEDQLALFIDRDEGLMRRVRFTLNGLESTRGAIAEVDTFDHMTRHGVTWPTRFHERLLRPFPLPVHDWTMAGLDVNRGLTEAEISGADFTGRALHPAEPLLEVN